VAGVIEREALVGVSSETLSRRIRTGSLKHRDKSRAAGFDKRTRRGLKSPARSGGNAASSARRGPLSEAG